MNELNHVTSRLGPKRPGQSACHPTVHTFSLLGGALVDLRTSDRHHPVRMALKVLVSAFGSNHNSSLCIVYDWFQAIFCSCTLQTQSDFSEKIKLHQDPNSKISNHAATLH